MLASEGRYVRGAKHGLFRYYDVYGKLDRQVLYRIDAEIWTATGPGATPPPELAAAVSREADQHTGADPATGFGLRALIHRDPVPRPYFTSLDRTTSLTRFGLQLGLGGGSDEVDFGESRRAEVFGNYRVASYGVYAQLTGSMLELDSGNPVDGRRTLEVGGTHNRRALAGTLTPRLGLLVPVGADDVDGFLSAATSSFQRPTDAAGATTSTLAVRSGASWTRSIRRLAFQADAGFDWLAGGAGVPFDALARVNAGVGFGSRNAMLSLELSNTVRLSDPSERIHALGLGGTIWIGRVWLTTFASRGSESQSAITGAVGYGL